jgi:hypothetical protein
MRMSAGIRERAVYSVLGGVVGILFSFGIGFLGGTLAGAGHGTGVFVALIVAPEPFGILIWPAIGVLLPWSRNLSVAIVILTLLMVQYGGVAMAISDASTAPISRVMQSAPGLVWFIILSYLSVQLLIITCLARSITKKWKEFFDRSRPLR